MVVGGQEKGEKSSNAKSYSAHFVWEFCPSHFVNLNCK